MTRNLDPRVYDRAVERGAWISDDGVYRYALWRCWDPEKPPLVFVMCNPSTADALHDDATIRKCRGFAERLGYGGIIVVNLYAYRSTDASKLRNSPDPCGPLNVEALGAALDHARGYGAVAAWGVVARENGPSYHVRVRLLERMAASVPVSLLALTTAGDGTPSHPLVLSYSLTPRLWRARA